MTETNVMLEAFAQSMRPPDRTPIHEWCTKHVKLPHSARSPQFDISSTPWLIDPMIAFSDNDNKEIVIVAPVGSGKTTLFEGAVPWIISEEPGPTLVVMQTEPEAKLWSGTRLKPSLKLCEPIKPLWPDDRHDDKLLSITFPHMPLLIGGANMSTLQSKSMRYVIGDEVWIWKSGMIEEARRRTHDRWNSRVLLVSQGSFEYDDFHEAFLQTVQSAFHWQCEECGEFVRWSFDDIEYEVKRDESDLIIQESVESSAELVCPHCEARYSDKVQTRRRLSESSQYKLLNKHGRTGHLGFTYSATCVWWIPWGKLALEWVKANEAKKKGFYKPLQQFKQKREAQFWSEDYLDNRSALVGADYLKSEFANGELWEGEAYRFMTVDVQRDHFWSVIRAWKVDGTSRLISEGKILTWDGVRHIQEQYNVQDKLVFIDAQYETDQCYCHCVKWGWTALRGEGKRDGFNHKRGRFNIKKMFSKVGTAKASSGGYASYIYWCNEPVKDILAVLRAGNGVDWEVPKDISDAYKFQIDSEVKEDQINKTTGQVNRLWVKKRENHLWDCEAMNLVVAIMMGLMAVEEPVDTT
jgi:phage terminase large subunit GpA-like protein